MSAVRALPVMIRLAEETIPEGWRVSQSEARGDTEITITLAMPTERTTPGWWYGTVSFDVPVLRHMSQERVSAWLRLRQVEFKELIRYMQKTEAELGVHSINGD